MSNVRGTIVPLRKERETISAELRASIHNRFDIEVIDAVTGKIKQRAQAENVICNQLWTKLFTPTTYFNYIHYGTGSGTPAAADTSLFTFLGYGTPSTANDVYTCKQDDGYISLRRKIQINESTASGSTLTEVGVAYGTSSSNLVTHAMLKDMNGNQISIAKSSTDIINIYATVFVHWDTGGYDGGKILMLDQYTYNMPFLKYLLGVSSTVSYNAFASDAVLPPQPYKETNGFVQKSCSAAYSAANKTITLTMSRLGASDYAISGGIASIGIGYLTDSFYCYLYLILISGGSWFSGSTITGEAVGTGNGATKDFSTDFPVIDNATIYVDGVAQSSGLTVDTSIPQSPIDRFLIPVGHGVASQYASSCWPAHHSVYGRTETTYYNPYYSLGIDSFTASDVGDIYVSDNLVDWVTITSTSGANTVAAANKNKKYWKLSKERAYNFVSNAAPATNIHFATAPASGAVITADYTTKTIAKDSNHVFDLTVTIQLGEYTA